MGAKPGVKKGGYRKGLKHFNLLTREHQLEIMEMVERGVKRHKIAEMFKCYYDTIPKLSYWNNKESLRRLAADNILVDSMGWEI